MRLPVLFCLLLLCFYGVSQPLIKKQHYNIINNSLQSSLVYEKALSHTQVDGLRYLNTRRKINIEGTSISIELFSAQELLTAYGKAISPLTIKNPLNAADVTFKLSLNNYSLLINSSQLVKAEKTQVPTNLFPKKVITTFGNIIGDDGGLNGNYANNENYTQTIYSDNGESPYLAFKSFSLENNFDIMYIYDGVDASAKLIGEYTGGNNPQIVRATGAYLTIVFISDGSQTQSGWSALLGRGTPALPSLMSAPNCASADPFCSSQVGGYNFPATTGNITGEVGPDYGCLGSEPNPAWYYLQIANSGPLVLNVAGSANADVDFICWGPFTSPTAPCTAGLTGGCGFGAPTNTTNSPCSGNIVDCSYSANATETCTIPNAVVGQYYMMMITNFSNQTQNIELSQTNTSSAGAGSTNCNIVNCGVTASNTGAYCVGQTISLSAATTNTTATTYAWTGPNSFSSTQQNPTIANSTAAMAGVYSVTGTTGGTVTCVATTTVLISTSTPPVVNSPTICAGDTVTLTASPATNTFVWSTGATTPTTTVNPTATTIYTVTGGVGTCTASNTSTVTVNPLPIISGPSITICAQQTGTLCASGGVSYTWTPGNMNGNCVLVSPAVSTNYTVIGTDAHGCTNIGGPISYCGVIVTPSPTITVTSNTLCVGGSAPIVASGATSYTWSAATTLSSTTIPNVTANPIVTTTYSVSGSNGGCAAGATSTVTVYPLPVYTVTAPPACVGFPLTINATTGFANYSINSTPPFSTNSTPITIPNASVAMAGNYIIVVTDAHGCITPKNVQIVVNPLPTITSSATPVCVSSTGTLTAYGAATYTWSPTTYLNPSQGGEVYIIPTTTANINYVVTGTDINGCTNTSNLTVQANVLPTVSIASTTTAGCAPQCATYTVTSNPAPSANSQYSWVYSNGQGASIASPTACFTTVGNNTVKLTYTDINGCVNTATASVITYPIPSAGFDYSPKPVTILTPDVSFSNETFNEAGGTMSYSWNFGDSLTYADTSNANNPGYTYQNADSYNVTLIATSPNGCKDTASQIIVVAEDFAVYVPNAFTPEGDGKNEIFKAEANGILDFTMYIFDRWGNNIFTTHDINVGWDGRRSNKGAEVLQEDVYVWKIQLRNVNHQGKSLTGTVTLLK